MSVGLNCGKCYCVGLLHGAGPTLANTSPARTDSHYLKQTSSLRPHVYLHFSLATTSTRLTAAQNERTSASGRQESVEAVLIDVWRTWRAPRPLDSDPLSDTGFYFCLHASNAGDRLRQLTETHILIFILSSVYMLAVQAGRLGQFDSNAHSHTRFLFCLHAGNAGDRLRLDFYILHRYWVLCCELL